MKYTCVDASNGMEYDLKATNDQAAVLEAFDDMTMAFSSRSERDFDIDAREGNTHCYIDKWADNAGEDDDPVATASIVWDFEFWTDYNTKGGYNLNEIRVDLFDDTKLTVKESKDFHNEIISHYLFFKTKQEVDEYCDEQLAKLKAMNCADALDDGCDNENADQNRRFCDFTGTTRRMVETLGMFEGRASKVIDREKTRQMWREAVNETRNCDEWLWDYEALLKYFTNIKNL